MRRCTSSVPLVQPFDDGRCCIKEHSSNARSLPLKRVIALTILLNKTRSRTPDNSSISSSYIMMLHAVLIFYLFGNVLAQVPSLGRCPNVETAPDFNVSEYLGRWYEAERYFVIFEFAGKCVTADYSEGDDDGTIKVVNSQISRLTGRPSSIEGTARAPNASDPAKLKVSFSSVPFGIEGDYWILGTDYESFAVVYSCIDLYVINFKYAWILTRQRDPDQAAIDKAVEVLNVNNIDRSPFLKTDQSNCTNE